MFDLDVHNLSFIISVAGIVFVALVYKIPRCKWLVLTVSILLSTRYLIWRGLFTLNRATPLGFTISLILLFAEIYGFIQILFFFIQVVHPTDRIPPKVADKELPVVDIFIPIFSEPADILYRTIVGCQALDYPAEKKKIYVLDDGHREEIKNLAAKLGCEYLTRAIRKYGKAGNLNNGLRNSGGEVIAFFDCDHVPVRSFLKETVGFFKDPKVALVQTPQHFYNPDIFQKNLKIQKDISHEQDLFFHLIQPGRDYYNSAIFCGSGAVFRRSALDDIGGFTQYAVIEDLPTSLEIHAKGYKSIYLNKDLSAGLAPESCAGYISQRKRWTKAGIQIALFHNPLFKKGLTFSQRLNYFATIYYFFHGIPRIIYLTWPLTYLLLNIAPIKVHIPTLVHYFLAHYLPSLMAINVVSKRHRNPSFNDVYDTIMSFPIAGAVLSILFRPKKQAITVTPKGERLEKSEIPPSVLPHTITFCLLLLGIGVGLYKVFLEDLYDAPLIICIYWAIYNVIVLLVALSASKERFHKRGQIRLVRKIDCNLLYKNKKVSGHTTDISENGCALVLDEPVSLDQPGVKLELISNYGEITKLKGSVVRYDRNDEKEFNVGIKFTGLDEATRQSVIRQMYSPANSWEGDHPSQGKGIRESFFVFISAPLKTFIREKVLKRVAPRFNISVPCKIVLGDRKLNVRARNISITGLTIDMMGSAKLPPEMDITLIRGNNSIMLPVRVVWQKQSKKMTSFGVEFLPPFQGGHIWEKLGY
jgi:cellulose synthase (UDP-forming)